MGLIEILPYNIFCSNDSTQPPIILKSTELSLPFHLMTIHSYPSSLLCMAGAELRRVPGARELLRMPRVRTGVIRQHEGGEVHCCGSEAQGWHQALGREGHAWEPDMINWTAARLIAKSDILPYNLRKTYGPRSRCCFSRDKLSEYLYPCGVVNQGRIASHRPCYGRMARKRPRH